MDDKTVAECENVELEKRVKLNGFSLLIPTFDKNGSGRVAIFFLPPSDGFSPNLNIMKQPYPEGIAGYDALSMSQFTEAGWNVSKHVLNEKDGEVYYEVNDPDKNVVSFSLNFFF